MTSWKALTCSLIIVLGVVSQFPIETDGGRVRKTKFQYDPPRLRDYVKVNNQWYKKPGDKRKRLRSEIILPNKKVVVKVPNPPVILHEVLEYWPYNRVYITSFLGIINYIHKILWIVYKIAWIFIDMFIVIVRIIFQVTEIGKLKHSYDELSKPHPFSFNHVHHDDFHHDYLV